MKIFVALLKILLHNVKKINNREPCRKVKQRKVCLVDCLCGGSMVVDLDLMAYYLGDRRHSMSVMRKIHYKKLIWNSMKTERIYLTIKYELKEVDR